MYTVYLTIKLCIYVLKLDKIILISCCYSLLLVSISTGLLDCYVYKHLRVNCSLLLHIDFLPLHVYKLFLFLSCKLNSMNIFNFRTIYAWLSICVCNFISSNCCSQIHFSYVCKISKSIIPFPFVLFFYTYFILRMMGLINWPLEMCRMPFPLQSRSLSVYVSGCPFY